MQVCAVNAYNFNSAKPNQQVGFRGGELRRVATVEQLLANAAGCNIIIDKIDRTTGLPKGIGAILIELSAKLSPLPNINPLGVLQRNESGRKQLLEQLPQMIFERAAQLGINIQRKNTVTLGREVLETEQLLARFKNYGVSPQSKDLAGLRDEVREIEETYKDAQILGIRTENKDLPTILLELASTPKTPNPQTSKPHVSNGANQVLGKVNLVRKAVSMTELLKTGIKTKDIAVLLFNALGIKCSVDQAKSIKLTSSSDEVRRAFRLLSWALRKRCSKETDEFRNLLNQAKNLLSVHSSDFT